MEVADTDQNQFFKLIKSQRSQARKVTDKIVCGNQTWEGGNVAEGFVTYYEELAKPKEHENFDNDHKARTELKVLLIEQMLNHENETGIFKFIMKKIM